MQYFRIEYLSTVLSDFIDLYLKFSEEKWSTNTQTWLRRGEEIRNMVSNFIPWYHVSAPTQDRRRELCKEIKNELKPYAEAEIYLDPAEWINLILSLRNRAEQLALEHSSDLTMTLHLMATLIQKQLQENKESDVFAKALEAKINQLKSKLNKKNSLIPSTMLKKHGMKIESINTKIQNLIAQLAFLGDLASINQALHTKLFNPHSIIHLPTEKECLLYHFDDANQAIPLCMQSEFFPYFYETRCKEFTKGQLTLEKFIQASIDSVDVRKKIQGKRPVEMKSVESTKNQIQDEIAQNNRNKIEDKQESIAKKMQLFKTPNENLHAKKMHADKSNFSLH